jgi:hypothetical protein
MIIRTFSDALAVVSFLTERQGRPLEEAIAEAQIPLHLVEQVRRMFSEPLQIAEPPTLLVGTTTLSLCAPDEATPQPYFSAFCRYLLDHRRWDPATVEALEQASLDLVRRLPRPDAAPTYSGRGLIVGHIQSGKTANMAALIARAADQGYKLFIILAGLWNDLRSQTQRRLDQDVVGHSDNQAEAPYVEHDPDALKWVRLTGSGLYGDFLAGTHIDLNPHTPKVAIIKKNPRIIEHLTQWLKKSPVPLDQLPAIVIDDEADQASINTNAGRVDDEGDVINPSQTNRRIRELLKELPRCMYIGLTATPFANVLIDAETPADLYPRDFIASLPEPPAYLGPRQLFGLGLTESDLSPEAGQTGTLDVIRHIPEEELNAVDAFIEEGGDCPRSLSDALLAFVLSSCARLARGRDGHMSMLVHPSQRTDEQRMFADAIRDELQMLKAVAVRPGKFPVPLSLARAMWDADFASLTRSLDQSDLTVADFDTVWKFARSFTEAIEIKVVNFTSPDELDYTDPPKRYVVIGGNRLSRGLTLEGLSVSFFTRNANQYDTLLQMGRWFGYRPGYQDLTRIYVGEELAGRFADLARVEAELRADLRKYARQPNPPTPLELKPVIRRHPTMAVTSPMKMGSGRVVNVALQDPFAESRRETVAFPVDNKLALRNNIDAARALLGSLPRPQISASDEGMHIWTDLPSDRVVGFLESYAFSHEAGVVNRRTLVDYITRQNKRHELTRWDIAVPRGNPSLEPFNWTNGIFSRKVHRSPLKPHSIRVLSSPGDIREWRAEAGRAADDVTTAALFLYLIDRESIFPRAGEGEDIVGLVFALPISRSNELIEYISQ